MMTSSNNIPSQHNLSTLEFILHNKQILYNKYQQILTDTPASCTVLHQALEYMMFSNGKNLRASLVFACCPDLYFRLLNKDDSPQNTFLVDAASAIELVHTYSIIHDDLPAMDNDDIRRGKPSCHKQFDEATAILVGDCLQAMAFSLISEKTIEPLKQLEIIKILSHAVGHQGMVAGQSLELSHEKIRNNSKHNSMNNVLNAGHDQINLLNQIHQLKTGKLFTACLQIATVINDLYLNRQQYELMTNLGEKIGLAFQIQDDLLDYTKTTAELGKPAHSDADRNLVTYSTVMGLAQTQTILDNLWQECFEILNCLEIDTTLLYKLISYIKDRAS